MPLSLNKNLGTGVSAGYFKLSNANFNALTGRCLAVISLYLNKAACDAGNQPVDQYQFDIALDITQSVALMTAIQTQLKAQPFLSGAQDAT